MSLPSSVGALIGIEEALVLRVCPQEGQSKQFAQRFFFNLASAEGMFSKQLGQ